MGRRQKVDVPHLRAENVGEQRWTLRILETRLYHGNLVYCRASVSSGTPEVVGYIELSGTETSSLLALLATCSPMLTVVDCSATATSSPRGQG